MDEVAGTCRTHTGNYKFTLNSDRKGLIRRPGRRRILKKQGVSSWTGFNWLGTVYSDDLREHCNKYSSSINAQNFLIS
jgi:hypothetical protein